MTEYRKIPPQDTIKILTDMLGFTREDADAMMCDARMHFVRNDGIIVTRTTPSGDRVTLERHAGYLYTVKVYEKPVVRPQFYVFRVKTPGYLPVWVEYMNGDVHTVFPLPYKRKRDAVNALNVMHPDAFVDTLCDIADKRYARWYVRAGWSGRQLPELQYGEVNREKCIHPGVFSRGADFEHCYHCETDVPRSEL